MKAPTTNQTAASGNSRKMLQAMVGIGVLCALLIVLTYEGTLPRIEQLRAEALERAIFKVLPGISTTKAFTLNEQGELVPPGGDKAVASVVYAGYDEQGGLVGVAIEAAGQGYADILRILYGYDPAKEAIIGFYVLESKETPGLGDKIEKDPKFLANFASLDVSLNEQGTALKNKVVPVKNGDKQHPWEVDCITGATISSRAIGNIIGASTSEWVPLIYNHRQALEQTNRENIE
jgi:electron transport complex protein RnfG